MLGNARADASCRAQPRGALALPSSSPLLEHQVEVEVAAIQGRALPPFAVVSGRGLSAAVTWTVRPAPQRPRREVLAVRERQREHSWSLAERWTELCVEEALGEPSDHLNALAVAWDLEVW